MCIGNPFDLLFLEKSQKSKLSLENKNLKWGEIIMKCFFFFLKYMLDTITGTPRNSYEWEYISDIFYPYSQF